MSEWGRATSWKMGNVGSVLYFPGLWTEKRGSVAGCVVWLEVLGVMKFSYVFLVSE